MEFAAESDRRHADAPRSFSSLRGDPGMCEATLNRTRAADLRAACSARSEDGREAGYTGREDAKTRGIPPNFRRRGHRSAATRQVARVGKPTRGNLLDSPSSDMPQEIPRVFSRRPLLSSLGQSFFLRLPPPRPRANLVPQLQSAARSLPRRGFRRPLQTRRIVRERRYAADCQSFIGARRARISRRNRGPSSRDLPRGRKRRS